MQTGPMAGEGGGHDRVPQCSPLTSPVGWEIPAVAERFEIDSKVLKVDEQLGLVFGWGMICSESGTPYYDSDAERVPAADMLKAVTEFAEASVRPTDTEHDKVPSGSVVHSFPLTDEIAKVFGIECDREGWMVAVRPEPEVLAKFASGEYVGFSVGGSVAGWTDEETA